MNTTTLVTPTEVKRFTPIKGGVDNDYLYPAILLTQDSRLEEVLGYQLKEKLIELEEAGTLISNDDDYTELFVNWVKPYLIWASVLNVVDAVYVDINNQGVLNRNSSQGSSPTEGDFETIQSRLVSSSEIYRNKLVRYLCDNSSKFPEYTGSQDDGQISPDKSDDAWNGWVNW